MKHEQRRVCEMIKRTVVQLCETGFASDNIQIRGVIGVTVNDSDVLIIHINEDVTEFGESSQQFHDRTSAESAKPRHRAPTPMSPVNVAATRRLTSFCLTTNESEKSNALPVQAVPSMKRQNDINTNESLQNITSDCVYHLNTGVQNKHCDNEASGNSEMMKEKVELIDDIFNPVNDCEMVADGSIVGSSACFEISDDDSVAETVKQEFLEPVCDDRGECNSLSLSNCVFSNFGGCQKSNACKPTFKTQASLKGIRVHGIPSRQSGHRELSRSLSLRPPRVKSTRSDQEMKLSMSASTSGSDVEGNYADNESSATGERRHKDCSKSFTWSTNLKEHRRRHNGERPYQCPMCTKRFNLSSHLKEHIRIHTGEKPFACTHCDMRFTQSSTLKSHLRTHASEEPFAGSQYSMRVALTQSEVLTNTGDHFQCPICSEKFNLSSHLKEHIRTHTGEKPFACKRLHEIHTVRWSKETLS